MSIKKGFHPKSQVSYVTRVTVLISTDQVGHRDGVALLSGWYNLLGEKRAWKMDFLKALCRVFDYDSSRTPTVSYIGQLI